MDEKNRNSSNCSSIITQHLLSKKNQNFPPEKTGFDFRLVAIAPLFPLGDLDYQMQFAYYSPLAEVQFLAAAADDPDLEKAKYNFKNTSIFSSTGFCNIMTPFLLEILLLCLDCVFIQLFYHASNYSQMLSCHFMTAAAASARHKTKTVLQLYMNQTLVSEHYQYMCQEPRRKK